MLHSRLGGKERHVAFLEHRDGLGQEDRVGTGGTSGVGGVRLNKRSVSGGGEVTQTVDDRGGITEANDVMQERGFEGVLTQPRRIDGGDRQSPTCRGQAVNVSRQRCVSAVDVGMEQTPSAFLQLGHAGQFLDRSRAIPLEYRAHWPRAQAPTARKRPGPVGATP